MIERRSLNGHKLSTKVSSDTVELSNPAVDHFAKKIQTAWQKAVSSILETGRLLIQAKQELAYGEFLLMIEERLPFGARTAQMLMRIAEHPVLSNTKFISHLPPSWGTLHRLTQLPEKAL